jgi:hypothetical protein
LLPVGITMVVVSAFSIVGGTNGGWWAAFPVGQTIKSGELDAIFALEWTMSFGSTSLIRPTAVDYTRPNQACDRDWPTLAN